MGVFFHEAKIVDADDHWIATNLIWASCVFMSSEVEAICNWRESGVVWRGPNHTTKPYWRALMELARARLCRDWHGQSVSVHATARLIFDLLIKGVKILFRSTC